MMYGNKLYLKLQPILIPKTSKPRRMHLASPPDHVLAEDEDHLPPAKHLGMHLKKVHPSAGSCDEKNSGSCSSDSE